MRACLLALTVVATLAGGCGGADGDAFLLVRVSSGSPASDRPILALRVSAEGGARTGSHEFRSPRNAPLTFPTDFSLQLERTVTAPVRLEVRALDAAGITVASATSVVSQVRRGRTQTVDVRLECLVSCVGDGGVTDAGGRDAAVDAPGGGSPSCGNGKIDEGETCDVGIAAGRPGACPATCDDGLACTQDMVVGSRCTTECRNTEMRALVPNDRCCPAGGTPESDSDCSATCGNRVIEPGETCDKGIGAGAPGACPTSADCDDKDPCTKDALVSAGTCSAVCVRQMVVTAATGDRCCPAGASSRTDGDCPVVCGNGDVETEAGETCDKGLAPPAPGHCPESCDDKNACTEDVLEGSGCKAVCRPRPITTFIPNDGCCPAGGNRTLDTDCPSICGNGVVEPGESCDKAIPAGRAGACPSACADDQRGCTTRRLEGDAQECSARCVVKAVTECARTKDGCCPAGCTAASDADCSATCGNGFVELGETCDVAIAEGAPNACPTVCTDNDACTGDAIVSKGTCNASCMFTAITAFMSGDRCCPPGGNAALDSDCPPVCGNQVVEPPKETCDRGIATGMLGACPVSCPAPAGCRRYVLAGDVASCNARCEAEPIRTCQNGDGCCPSGCHRNDDNDCAPVCGNGVLEPGEACDKGITAGNPGACRAICGDGDACTVETTSGRVEDCTRACTYDEVKACTSGDKCCPAGCTGQTDRDCTPMCGNGTIEKGETCDPPSACPTVCPDDGDLCTADKLVGDPAACSAACTHVPVTTCSGATPDRCCPTGCTGKQDVDCPAAGVSTFIP